MTELEPNISRRVSLRVFIGSLVALALSHRRVEAQSQGMILGRQAWSTRLWWPIFTERGVALDLPKIHDDWWPAHVLDRMYKAEGGLSDVQQQAINKAEIIKKNHPNTVNSAGYCPWVSIAQTIEERPQAFSGEDLDGETDPKKIVPLKEGFLAIKHAGDILVPVPATRETLTAVVEDRLPAVVDLPAELGAGNWFRPLLGISEDGVLVRVTNFGHPDRNLPISGIIGAYIVYPGDSTENFKAGVREATSFWRYNVDRGFIDRVVYRR